MNDNLTEQEVARFRELLEARKAELECVSKSADEARRTVELDQTRQGRLSRIDALQGQEMSKAAERRRQLELTRIASAFKRVEDGEYGDCTTLRRADRPAPAGGRPHDADLHRLRRGAGRVTATPGPRFRLADAPTRHARDDPRGYEAALSAVQHELRRLQLAYLSTSTRGIVVLEGWDAAGKGGVIRRMAAVLEPRACAFHPIGPPDPVWQGRHWLARFWPLLPQPGRMAVFDRSWYGRVLVERVEGLADHQSWSRAYDEILAFERMLLDDGVRLVKIFLHVSAEEQLRRFQKRLDDPVKRWKIGMSDIRNWELRGAYEEAIEEMVRRTSERRAPWHVIPADDKKYARVRCMELIFEGLRDGLDLSPPSLDSDVARAARERLNLTLPETG